MNLHKDKGLIKSNMKMFQNPFVPEYDLVNGFHSADLFNGVNSNDVFNGVDDSHSSDSIVFERIGSYDDSISSGPTSLGTAAVMDTTDNKVALFGKSSANNLMLLSLLEHLCTLYVDDEDIGKRLFELLCNKLCTTKFGTLDNAKAIRQKYQAAFANMMRTALESLNPLHTDKLWQITTKRNVTSLSLHSWYKDMFHEEKLIAFGGFGEVCKAKNKLDQKLYAIKKVKLIESQPEICQKTLREVQVFSNLSHPNIVRYHSSWLEYGLTEFTCSKRDECVMKSNSEKQRKTDSAADGLVSLDLLESQFGTFNVGLLKNRKCTQNYISYEKDVSGLCDENLNNLDDGLSNMYPESPPSDDKKPGRKRFNSLGRSLSSGDVPIHHTQMEEVNYCRGKFYDANLCKALNMTLFIQMELCQLTLRRWIDDRNSKIQKSSTVDRSTNLRIFKQIIFAIQYIHSEGLIHRDIKPANIFINFPEESNIEIKVGDLGLARDDVLPKSPATDYSHVDIPASYYALQPNYLKHTEGVGTAVYAAPEQKSTRYYSNKVDIYSIGIILFELYRPFNTDMERLKSIQDLLNVRTCGDIEEIFADECELIRQMTSRDSNKRPSANSIVDLPLLAHNCNTDDLDHLKSKLAEQEIEITRLKCLVIELQSNVCNECLLECTHKGTENKQ